MLSEYHVVSSLVTLVKWDIFSLQSNRLTHTKL